MISKASNNYKIIFDARGFLPEEIALKKGLEELSPDYKFFKEIERLNLKESDSTITVSDTMLSEFRLLGAKRLDNIYLSTDFPHVVNAKATVENKITTRSNITLLYLGALGQDLWHQPKQLAKVFLKVKSIFPSARLKIITTNDHKTLKQYFIDFKDEDVIFSSTKTKEELELEMANINIAILPYRINRNYAEKHVGFSILGTKTVEYLAAGIPLLCNLNCGGASAIIESNVKFGVSYDPDTLVQINEQSLLKLLNSKIDYSEYEFLKQKFDYKSNSKKYANLYSELIS